MTNREQEIINQYKPILNEIENIENEIKKEQEIFNEKEKALNENIQTFKNSIPQKVRNIIAKNILCNASNDQEWPDYCKDRMGTLANDFRLFGGGCVKCGEYVTSITLGFYGFDVERVMCYECQDKQ